MTKVTVSETTYSVTVAEETVNVTVADASETIQVQIASGASDTQIISTGETNSLISSTAGVVTTLKTLTAGSNITLGDDGDTITISSTDTEDDLSNNTTDDLAEGSNNLYFTDARVDTALSTVSGHIIPSANVTYDLGSTTNMWRDVYVGPGSLYVNGQKVISSQTGQIDITTDPNENLNVQAGGDITMLSSNSTTTLQDATLNLGPAAQNGTTNVRGTLDVAVKIEMGDLDITSGQLHQDAVNGDLTLKTNGTGRIIADTTNLVVGTLAGDNTQITPTGITGDVTGTVSSIANHDTDALSEGSTNLYHTTARVQSVIDTNTAGFITDYTVTESDVTQHQAALSITESQISDLDHYDSQNFDTDFGNKSTTDLSEGTNLYYTTARFDSAFSGKSTTDLTEGTNLYFTDARARSAVSLNSSNTNELSYDSSTGVFSYTSPSTVAATGQVVFDVRNASGVDIARGDAVYISGHSGGKILVAKADANVASTMPAIGLANSAMTNNSDGSVLVGGEMASIDTSAFSVGDVLYVSETAGELTATRPSAETTNVQNIGKVARSDNQNGIIIVVGSGRANDVPNLDHLHVFIGDTTGYETRQLDTSDITEDATNLFYTDARVQSVIDTNTAGFITDYTVTQSDVTQHQAALSITESQISDLSHYTNANAISAVEGEATLDLTGDVTIAQDLDVTGLIKVNDGFTVSSFNPFQGSGLPATAMDTTIMGIGQEEGYAGLTVRSRGEHDWGLSAYGIPPEKPKALLALQASRLDGGSDDYLNTDDNWASIQMNPYSGYKTGTEYLTPSIFIEGIATEDHSASGMGAKLRIGSTENGNAAGATDTTHTNKHIDFQGSTITTSDTLKIDDDLIITGGISNDGGDIVINDKVEINGANLNETIIGDDQAAATYDIHGIKVKADDTKWASITLQEYVGGANKPFASGFSNPTFGTEIIGGSPGSESNGTASKRLFLLQALASNETDGTLPTTANFRIKAETTQDQTTANRGTKVSIETTADNANSTTETLKIQGDTLTINTGGNGVIAAGSDLKLGSQLDTNGNDILNNSGDVTIDDTLQVNQNLNVSGNADITGTLDVDGSVVLGDSNQDSITANGEIICVNGLRLTVLNTSTANYLSGVLGIINTGAVAYISDGDGGSPCLGVYNGSSWKRIAFGADISST